MNIRKRWQDAGNIEVRHILARHTAIRPKLPVTGCRVNVPASSTKQKKMAPTSRHKIQGVQRAPVGAFPWELSLRSLAIALAAAFVAAPALAKPRSIQVAHGRAHLRRAESRRLSHRGIEWSPDAKRISYLERAGGRAELWTMDAATGDRKVLVNANVLADVMQPRKANAIQSTGLGRVEAENYLWSPSGDALLFIGSSDLVLLDLKTMSVEAARTPGEK